MPRLGPSIPPWVAGYVGIRFAQRGRDRDGIDCWGLVRLVYAERLGVWLPSLADRYEDLDDVEGMAAAMGEQLGGETWRDVGQIGGEVGDVVLHRMPEGRWHVGLMVSATQMLHAWDGTDSCVDRIDSPRWARRVTGQYRYAGPVRITGRPRPLSGPRIDVISPTGLTVLEHLAAAGLGAGSGLRVFVGDIEVQPERWGTVRPKAGRVIRVAADIAGGGGESGGKTALRIVAAIAIVALAAYAGPVLAGALGMGASKVGAAMISGAIVAGGTLAINALIPPPRAKLSQGDDRTSPAIAGARNEARPYGRVPRALGEYRFAPPFGAKPYTEVVGSDQYLRLLFIPSYGPVEIDQIKIGDTPIEEFDGVELQIRNGFPGEAPVSLYPGIVDEEALNVLVTHDGGPVVRVSGEEADEISVDLTWPQGLARINREGGREPIGCGLQVEYRLVGSSVWRQINEHSPESTRQMDLTVGRSTTEAAHVGIVHASEVSWGAGMRDPKPAYLPASAYGWMAEGWIFAPTAGVYTFAIDGSDAIDLFVRNQLVASWYGIHTPEGGGGTPSWSHSGTIQLAVGWHPIRLRVEARTQNTAGAAALGWKRPGDAAIGLVPRSALFRTAGRNANGILGPGLTGLRVTWFDTSGLTSSVSVIEATTAAVRRNVSWAVEAPGRYEVRVTRVTEDRNDDRTLDQVFWTALRTIRNRDPVRLENVAKIALRIKATDQLNGVVDTLNCVVRSILPVWDAFDQVWREGVTNNPAGLYRGILQARGNARPVPDSRLDLVELQSWHAECVAKGWAFNGVIDFAGSVLDRLADVAAAGRASPTMRDGKYSIVRDRPQSVPVQHFTPRNSHSFRGRKGFPDLPHGLRVQFMDATNGYARSERIVLDDGYQLDGKDAFGSAAPHLPPATRFEVLELFGITDPGLAFKHGRYHIAVARLRPELLELSTDVEHLACTRGDLVLVSHDVPMWGNGFGRVAALTLDAGDNLLGLVLDSEITMDPGVGYRLRVRLDTGESWVRNLTNVPGTSRAVTFTGPVAPGAPRPKAGDLFMFGREGLETRELIVHAIDMERDLGARLTFVDHAPAVHQADVGAIPPWDPGISQDPIWSDGPEDPVIESIRSDDWAGVRNADGTFRPRMLITLRTPSSTRPLPTMAQVRTRPIPPPPAQPTEPWTYHPMVPLEGRQVAVDPVTVGTTYDIRLRVITPAGQASRWVAATHTVVGNILPPPDVQSFDVQRLSDGTRRYSWVLGPIPPDIAGVLIRFGALAANPTWEAMQPLHTGVMDGASPQELNDPPAGAWRFGIKMIDFSGNESVNAIYVDRTLGAARRPNSLMTIDAKADGWPGVKTGCHVSWPGPGLEADDRATWATLASVHGISTWAAWWRWNLEPTSPIVYEHPAIDLGVSISTSPLVSVVADGAAVVEFRSSTDNVTWTPWTSYDAIAGTAVEARYHQWRATVAATTAQPVPLLRELVMDAIGTPVEQFLDNLDTATLVPPFRAAAGDVRIPIDATRFRVIRQVGLTFNGTGAGWSYAVADKLVSPGPRVRIFNPSLQGADAVVDVTVRGF